MRSPVASSLKLRSLAGSTLGSVFLITGMILGSDPTGANAQIRPLLGPVLVPAVVDGSDPLPIRRVLVPLERVSAELERAGAKKLVHLSQEEFEARLRAARIAQSATLERPRLVEARFQASLVGTALVGTADWRLSYSGILPGIYYVRPLDGRGGALNLALRQASLDGSAAILGDVEPRSLGLLIEKPGVHHLTFDWSVRGEASPNGIRFDLRVPNCVLNSFEIDLPAGRLLTSASEQCLVTGPFPAPSTQNQRWVVDTLNTLNRSRIELTVRTPDRQDRGSPLFTARIEERQNLSLDQVECIHDFTLDVSRGAVRELDLTCSPGLQPVSVVWRNADLENWQFEPPAAGQKEGRLHIRLPEALTGGPASLRIRAIAAGPLDQLWHSPELRLQKAVALSEKLTLQVAPELELADWDAGRFDLTKTANDPLGSFMLQLQAGPFASDQEAGTSASRPRARPRLLAAQASARVQLWWDIGLAGEQLAVRARVEPRSGPLFRLKCRIPSGWRVERTELSPAGLLADWSVLDGDKSGSVIIMHLNEAIEASRAVTVLLHLSRPPQPATGSQQTFDLPRVEVLSAYSQVSSLGVSVAGQLRVKAAPGGIYWQRPEANDSVPPQSSGEAEKPLWENHALWGLASFHGLPPAGQLVVEGLVPLVKAHSTCRIDLSHDLPRVGLRIELEAVAGSLQTLDIQFSAPIPEDWHWTGADGRPISAQPIPAWESLCLPGITGGPLERLNLLAFASARHQRWRFTLAVPLTGRRTIEKALTSEPPGSFWPIALPLRVNDEPIAGEIELVGAGAGRAVAQTHGLLEASEKSPNAGRPDAHQLVYDREPIALEIRAPGAVARPVESGRVDGVTLTTCVDRTGLLRERLTFRLQKPGAAVFPLSLPVDVRVLAMRVDGRWVATSLSMGDQAENILSVPTPSGSSVLDVEIDWERSGPGWRLWNQVPTILPKFPGLAPSIRRVWLLAPGLIPAQTAQLLPLPGYADGTDSGVQRWLATRLATGRERGQWQHLVAEAEVQIQGLANDAGTVPLGPRIQRLVKELTREQAGLVVDVSALRENGLGPNSLPGETKPSSSDRPARSRMTLTAAFLQPFGLTLLSTGSTPLLTTQRAGALMGEAASSPATEQALLEAARFGRDASGRFENAIVWLNDPGSQGPTLPLIPDEGRPSANWSSWQSRGTASDASSLLIVQQDGLRWVGYVFLLSLTLVAWRVRNQRQALFALACLVFLSLLILGVVLSAHLFWALAGPALGGLLLGLAWLLLQRGPAGGVLSGVAAPIPSAAVALALLAALPSWASAPTDFTVLLLAEEGGKKVGVLAPLELLDSLHSLIEHSKQPLERPILLEARYQAKAVESMIDFDADFVIYSPSQGTADFALNLAGAELREARCDLLPALPLAAPAGQTGYVFQLKGSGRHTLRLRFSAPVNAQGAERDCRISVPETVLARLDFTAPAGSQRLQAVLARGAQQVTTEAGGVRLRADLGRTPTLQIRWRVAVPKEEQAALEVKELYLWDLQAARRLLGVFRYQVVRGSVSALSIDVPPEWEVRRVETAAVPGSLASRLPLRDWTIAPGPLGSRLQLEFQAPLTTSVQVYVELLSRKPATTFAQLALPTPVAALSNGGLLAYHLGPQDAVLTQSLGFTGVDVKSFVTQWQSAGVEDPGSVERAFSFRRSAGAPPTMHLELKSPADFTANQEIVWRVGPRELVCETVLNLTGRGEDLMFVEWNLPAGLHLEGVQCPDVQAWSVSGQRVQVWLRPGIGKAALTWRAWMSSTRPPGEAWSIPVVPLLRAIQPVTNVRVEAESGWTVAAGKLVNLHAVPGTPGVLSFAADQPNFSAEVVLQEAKPNRAGKAVEMPAAPAERPVVTAPVVYSIVDEQAALQQQDGHWEHRADYYLLAGAGQAAVCPPQNAKITAAFLDGHELSPGTAACLSLRFDGQLRRRHLRIYWQWPPGHESVTQPDLDKPMLENVTPLPGSQQDEGLWEIVTPSAASLQAVDRSAVPVGPELRYLRRAAAALSVARFVSPREKGLFQESQIQFQRDAEAASAWLAQGAGLQARPMDVSELEDRLEQLESEKRVLLLSAPAAELRRSEESPIRNAASGFNADRDSKSRFTGGPGIPSFWRSADKDGAPRVTLEPSSGAGLGALLEVALVVLIGTILLVLVSPWTTDTWRKNLRPESVALLGTVAGFLSASWLMVLIALCAGLAWRAAQTIRSYYIRSAPAQASELATAGNLPSKPG